VIRFHALTRHNRRMCARYHSVLDASRLKQFFSVQGLRDLIPKPEVFPGLSAPFIRRPREHGAEMMPCQIARF
jgi:hypothetical protein